jgi:hypothetical protein
VPKPARERFPGLFGPPVAEVKPPAPPEAVEPGNCLVCNHPPKSHCKSGVRHTTYKAQARMERNPKVSVCETRHCEEPLCSCTSLALRLDDICYPDRPYKSGWTKEDRDRWYPPRTPSAAAQ